MVAAKPASLRAGDRAIINERIMGATRDLLSVEFFEIGLDAARSVGRLSIEGDALGTGFLVGCDLMMTNNHVLATAEDAADRSAGARLRGNDLRSGETTEVFELDPERFFMTDPDARLHPGGGQAEVPGRHTPARLRLQAADRRAGQDPRLPAGQHHPASGRPAQGGRDPQQSVDRSVRQPGRHPVLPVSGRHRAGLVGLTGVQRSMGDHRPPPPGGAEDQRQRRDRRRRRGGDPERATIQAGSSGSRTRACASRGWSGISARTCRPTPAMVPIRDALLALWRENCRPGGAARGRRRPSQRARSPGTSAPDAGQRGSDAS